MPLPQVTSSGADFDPIANWWSQQAGPNVSSSALPTATADPISNWWNGQASGISPVPTPIPQPSVSPPPTPEQLYGSEGPTNPVFQSSFPNDVMDAIQESTPLAQNTVQQLISDSSPIPWVTGPDGVQRPDYTPQNVAPMTDTNGNVITEGAPTDPPVNPYSVLGGTYDPSTGTITYPDGSVTSDVQVDVPTAQAASDNPSITVMGDDPNAVSPVTDPSGAGLADPTLNLPPDQLAQAPVTPPPDSAAAPSPSNVQVPSIFGVGPQGPVGPSGVGFGGHGTTGTGVGPNMGGNGSGFYGGTVSLGGGAVAQRGTGMDPFQQGSTMPGPLHGAAEAEQTGTALDNALARWISRGGTEDSFYANMAAQPMKQQKGFGVSAATAAAAAKYWKSSGGFKQKAGTSGATTIG